jgi:topoisomerase-4 subunit A
MAKKREDKPIIVEHIQQATLEDIMGERYATYAKYVIQDRAIPDIRDGLKPVQRRIIYAMHHAGNTFYKPYRKCATSVGDVMGKYHPHGDASIYDALVHMSQPWKFRIPLIDFQGNNGSIDGDNAAAHRYTESRLAHISELLVQDIEKNTVDMQLTFDDSQKEPVVLPARFPNLLLNGTQGIAVAMATNIPPHNLSELIEATIFRITHKRSSLEDLLTIVQGPDFPTGGLMYQTDQLQSMYTSGHGRVEILSKVETVVTKDSHQLIITEIPYGVVKSSLVKAMDEIRFKKIIDGIIEVRDESDHQGLRIAIDLKKDAQADKILAYLYAKTDLKSSFSANMVAINKGHPTTFGLVEYIDAYIDHQVDVITRVSQFNLHKATARLEIVEGLIRAISMLDDVVKTIRASVNKQDAMANLEKAYGFSSLQADAIVSLQLYKLTNTDITLLEEEKQELTKTIQDLEGILSDHDKLDRRLIADLKAINKQFGTPRKTQLIQPPESTIQLDKRDLIAKEEVMIAMTQDGYMKRSSMKSYRSSGDNAYPGMKPGDSLIAIVQATTLDTVLAFTDKGQYLYIPVYDLPDTKWKDEGIHINNKITLPSDDHLIAAMIVESFELDARIVLLSKRGQIKKSRLADFNVARNSKPVMCMRLSDDDSLVGVAITNGRHDIVAMSEKGKATRFSEKELSTIGVKASGVKSMQSLSEDDAMISLFTVDQDERQKRMLVTKEGHVRLFDVDYINATHRLGKVQYVFQSFKSEPHTLCFTTLVDKQKDVWMLDALTSDLQIIHYQSDDFAPTPIDKYAKKNLPLKKDQWIRAVFPSLTATIPASLPTYQEVEVAPEEHPIVEQLSIFDDTSDE